MRIKSIPSHKMLALLGLLGAAGFLACSDPADPPPEPEGPVVDGVRLRVLTEDLHHPVAIAVVPDGSRMFIAERLGAIRVIEDGSLLSTPLLDLRDSLGLNTVEQGLLGLALDPAFESNGRFYVNYTAKDNNTRVVRYQISPGQPNRADPESGSLVLEVEQPGARHNGGNLLFGPDGNLYIGMGDGGTPAAAQDPSNLLGALLRLDVENGDPYSIPSDNPFAGVDGRDEIWATGLRNPWRFSFDPVADRLIIADVGANLWEEINVVTAGAAGLNYGWPEMEGAECVAPEGCPADTVEPVLTYDYSDGSCAVVGGYVYRGDALPDLQGHYFFGDNCKTTLRSFHPSNPSDVRVWDFGPDVGQVFSFGVDADRNLYVLTIHAAYRFEPVE